MTLSPKNLAAAEKIVTKLLRKGIDFNLTNTIAQTLQAKEREVWELALGAVPERAIVVPKVNVMDDTKPWIDALRSEGWNSSRQALLNAAEEAGYDIG